MSVQVWGTLWGFLSLSFIAGGLYIARQGLGAERLSLTWLRDGLTYTLTAAGGDVAPAAVATDTMMGAGAAVAAPEAVNDFLRYADERRARADAELTHEYTADGLRRLAAALGAIEGASLL